MKRHSSLIPLSSHHQNALVLAKRLRGMKPETPEEDRIRMAQTALEFWVQGGREHFRDEEEVVLPIWARHSSIWSPEVERMLQDHLAIRSALDGLAECLSTGEAPDWRALSEMGERLDGPKKGQKVAISGPPQKWGQKWPFLHGETPPKMALFDAKSNFRYFSQGPLDKKRVLGVKILRGGVPRGFQINPLGICPPHPMRKK